MPQEYYVFSDESRHTAARYRCIAAVSLPASQLKSISKEIRRSLDDSGIQEFKWKWVRSAKFRFGAIKLIDLLFTHVLPAGGRIDALIWDTRDSRHAIRGRDDIKNYERMFFHLHRNLMKRRERGAKWHIRPDERVDVAWDTLKSCLGSVGLWRSHFEHPLLRETFSERFFEISTLEEVSSTEKPLCQLADLFAGIAPYSRDRSSVVRHLCTEDSGQGYLFGPDPDVRATKADIERSPVIIHLSRGCKARRLGVSLLSKGYLCTRDPSRPVNFWHYEPQHEYDKAPVRD